MKKYVSPVMEIEEIKNDAIRAFPCFGQTGDHCACDNSEGNILPCTKDGSSN